MWQKQEEQEQEQEQEQEEGEQVRGEKGPDGEGEEGHKIRKRTHSLHTQCHSSPCTCQSCLQLPLLYMILHILQVSENRVLE